MDYRWVGSMFSCSFERTFGMHAMFCIFFNTSLL
nr:MAG TPA: hypothetical protein [Bacteriophage sp.]